MALLVYEKIGGERAYIDLTDGTWVLGSAPACEVVIDVFGVSRVHCEFVVSGGGTQVEVRGAGSGQPYN